MTDLERSHAELRAALRLAGREIRKLNFGRADSPTLKLLRKVLRESREVSGFYFQSPPTLGQRQRHAHNSANEVICVTDGGPH